MTFDLASVPFSYPGSYWAFSWKTTGENPGLYLKNVRQSCEDTDYRLFRIALRDQENEVEFTATGHPTHLTLHSPQGDMEILFSQRDTLVFFSDSPRLSLQFTLCYQGPYTYFYQSKLGEHPATLCNLPRNRIKIGLQSPCGQVVTHQTWDGQSAGTVGFSLVPQEAGFVAILEEIEIEWEEHPYLLDKEQLKIKNQDLFAEFLQGLPPLAPEEDVSRTLAGYILWSCLVKKSRFLTRDGVYMSKNEMCNLWSWDNCMNAIALSYGHHPMALDQLMLPLDYQHSAGSLPDLVNDVHAQYNFSKPPIYGWTILNMQKYMEIAPDTLKTLFLQVEKLTLWWLTHRDGDGDGICEYLHGNDSGWDNSTLFLEVPPVESPDLQTFLILQMDFLIQTAKQLQELEKVGFWQEKQDALLKNFLEHCFLDDFPVAKQSGTHHHQPSASLLCYLPLLLGEKLPEKIRKNLIQRLKEGQYLTEYGLATEPLDSPYYREDGYWRGAIWGIATVFVTEALEKNGEENLAREIASRFSKLVAKSGLAENYNAKTGAPLRDKAFTWTASCYLYLTHRYGDK